MWRRVRFRESVACLESGEREYERDVFAIVLGRLYLRVVSLREKTEQFRVSMVMVNTRAAMHRKELTLGGML